jgi:hypothetical protein
MYKANYTSQLEDITILIARNRELSSTTLGVDTLQRQEVPGVSGHYGWCRRVEDEVVEV